VTPTLHALARSWPLLLLCAPAHARDDGYCDGWTAAQQQGQVAAQDLDEVSGLAASHRHEGALWMHNDHGGGAVIYAVGPTGQDWGEYTVLGAENEDWEDMAVGPCEHGLEPCTCLHIGDFGDNKLEREGGVVYRVEEPSITESSSWSQVSLLDAIHFRYPDGQHDAETLLVHPDTGEVLIVTKDDKARVFAFPQIPPAAATENAPVTLELVVTLDLQEAGAIEDRATAGEVSPRGSRVVLRTDEDLLVFSGTAGEFLEDILQQDPVPLPTPPPGPGEAVAISADGLTLYMVSEGDRSLWTVTCASLNSDGDDEWDPLADCEDEGCGCRGDGGQAALLLPLALFLPGWRRRRP